MKLKNSYSFPLIIFQPNQFSSPLYQRAARKSVWVCSGGTVQNWELIALSSLNSAVEKWENAAQCDIARIYGETVGN